MEVSRTEVMGDEYRGSGKREDEGASRGPSGLAVRMKRGCSED